MKKFITISLFVLSATIVRSQAGIIKDTISYGRVTVTKDTRLDILTRKEAEFNEAITNGPKTTRGYRLMVLSTSDRAMAMNLRAQLLQRYPEQKVYMSFQPPYIKLKFGNFLDKAEADQYREEFMRNKLVPSNIYLVPENIEIKGDKLKEFREKEKESQ
ncbi:MAG: SPOR domain-containing protein [Ferruginibacter sp.]